MTWTDQSSAFGYGTTLTSAQMQQLRDNLLAVCNADSGAPKIQNDAIEEVLLGSIAPCSAGNHMEYESGWAETQATSPELLSFAKLGRGGQIRARICLIQSDYIAGRTVYGQVYVNSSAVGSEVSLSDYGPAYYEQDLAVDAGAWIGIYGRTNTGVGTCRAKFQVGVSNPIITTPYSWI